MNLTIGDPYMRAELTPLPASEDYYVTLYAQEVDADGYRRLRFMRLLGHRVDLALFLFRPHAFEAITR